MNIFERFWRWLMSLFFQKELVVTVIGLSGAGKTTLVKAFSGEDPEAEDPSPTLVWSLSGRFEANGQLPEYWQNEHR